MSYQEPTYEYRGEWQAPPAPPKNATQTVRTALAIAAYTLDPESEGRRACLELLERNDWTVYFP